MDSRVSSVMGRARRSCLDNQPVVGGARGRAAVRRGAGPCAARPLQRSHRSAHAALTNVPGSTLPAGDAVTSIERVREQGSWAQLGTRDITRRPSGRRRVASSVLLRDAGRTTIRDPEPVAKYHASITDHVAAGKNSF